MLPKNIDTEALKKALEDGTKTGDIAQQLGISSATVSYWKRKLQYEIHCVRYDWVQVQRDYDSGFDYRALRKKYGMSLQTLTNAVKRGELKLKPRVKSSPEDRKRLNRETWMRYFSRKKYQTPQGENLQEIKEFYKNCPDGYEVDHIIPLSKGGLHTLSNLQYLTKLENRRKSNKLLSNKE